MSYNKKALRVDLGKYYKPNPYKKDIITDPAGQWKYPGQPTRIPGNEITMQGIPYPVYGQDDQGNGQIMYPGQNYVFPGNYVDEYPQMQKGGTRCPKGYYMDEATMECVKIEIPERGIKDANGNIRYFNGLIKNYKYPANTKAANAWETEKLQFPYAVDDADAWYSNWYAGRMSKPQFAQLAEQRFNASANRQTPYVLQAGPAFDRHSPGSVAVTFIKKVNDPASKPYENKIVVNSAVYPDEGFNDYYNSLFVNPNYAKNYLTKELVHEKSHWDDNNYPQPGISRLSVKDDKVLNKILPGSYYVPGKGSMWDNDTGTPTYNFYENLPKEELEYLSRPTEVRARLNVWRKLNNISPTKDYSPSEIEEIINNNIQDLKDNPDKESDYKNILELYHLIHAEPKILKQLNDSYVSTDSKKELDKAKVGGIPELPLNAGRKAYHTWGYTNNDFIVNRQEGGPTYISDPNLPLGYDALDDTINYDPNDSWQNINNPAWKNHEDYHHKQNMEGRMSLSGIVGQRPNPYVASDDAIAGYYNRRENDLQNELDNMQDENPMLHFIPREKLRYGQFNENGQPIFLGAEERMYSNPNTEEGEARLQEQEYANGGYIEADLTPEEIQQYRDGGYIVEDISVPQLTKAQIGLIKNPYHMPAGVQHPMQVVPKSKKTPVTYKPKYDPLLDSKVAVSESTKPTQTFNPNINIKDAVKEKKDEREVAAYLVSVDPLLSEKDKVKILSNPKKIDENIYRVYQDENQDEIKQVTPQSKKSRAWEYVTNPLTALKYSITTGDMSNMPHNINEMRRAGVEVDPNNLVGNILNDFYNPASVADNITRSFNEGDYLSAGLDALTFVPGVGLVKKIGKGVDKLALSGLKKLKAIPKQQSLNNFVRAGVGSMDMSQHTIKNPDYYTQLLDTYTSNQLSPSNKKFYKDLIETVKKQEGVVTQRQYNELQRLNTGNFDFGKKAYDEGGSIDLELSPDEIKTYQDQGYTIEYLD